MTFVYDIWKALSGALKSRAFYDDFLDPCMFHSYTIQFVSLPLAVAAKLGTNLVNPKLH